MTPASRSLITLAQPPAYQVPQPAPQSSLEDMMKAQIQSTEKFTQKMQQSTQELKEVFRETKEANTQATVGLEEWIGQSEKEYPAEHQFEPITQY